MKKILPILFFICFIAVNAYGALVEGTNCGFVTSAPTADPDATPLINTDTTSRTCKFTAPAGATAVTEIGWWCDNATEAANFEVGLYTDDGNGATSLPVTLMSGVSRTNAKGTAAGWKKATVNIPVTAGTIYWLAFQLDETTTKTSTDGATGGARRSWDGPTTTLPTTWSDSGSSNNIIAVYAVYTTESPAANTSQVIVMGE